MGHRGLNGPPGLELHFGWIRCRASIMAGSIMLRDPLPTGYARLAPLQARVVLAALVVMTAVSVGITLSPLKSTRVGKTVGGEGDIGLYREEVQRIHSCEVYLPAATQGLGERGYPP